MDNKSTIQQGDEDEMGNKHETSFGVKPSQHVTDAGSRRQVLKGGAAMAAGGLAGFYTLPVTEADTGDRREFGGEAERLRRCSLRSEVEVEGALRRASAYATSDVRTLSGNPRRRLISNAASTRFTVARAAVATVAG